MIDVGVEEIEVEVTKYRRTKLEYRRLTSEHWRSTMEFLYVAVTVNDVGVPEIDV